MRKTITINPPFLLFSKILALLTVIFLTDYGNLAAQCATSTGPTNNCTYGDAVDSLRIGNIGVHNYACLGGSNGYSFFATPVWNFTLGSSYLLYAETGGNQYQQGLSIWIDMNNNGFFEATEYIFSSPASLTHSGTFNVPATGVTGIPVRMRVRATYNTVANSGQACTNSVGNYGETEDYNVILSPMGFPEDAKFIGFSSPADSSCSDGNDTIVAWVANVGLDTLNDLAVNVMLGGDFSGSMNDTVATLLPGDTTMVSFPANFFSGGSLILNGWTAHPGDTNDTSNDSLMASLTIFKTLTISGPDTICSGDTVMLMADTGSGIGYAWFDMAMGGSALSNANPFNAGAITVTDTFWLEGTGKGCPNRVWKEIMVGYTPATPLANADTLCPGDSTMLDVAANPPYTHYWFTVPTGGSPFASGDLVNSGAVNSTTTFYVGVLTGCLNRSSVTVTAFNDLPAISALMDPVCEGTGATLYVSPDLGDYTWYDAATGGNMLGTGDTLNTAVLSGPTSFYAELDGGGYCSGRGSISIGILQQPSGGSFTYSVLGNMVTFTSTVSGTVTYAWDFGDGSGTSTQANPTYTYANAGFYTVTLVISNACGSQTITNQVDVVSVDRELESIGINVYPNPTLGNLTLHFVSFTGKDVQVRVTSLDGKLISMRTLAQVTPGQKVSMNLDQVPAGVYILTLTSNQQVYSSRIVKE
ncbi:MAG: T9SS type A sorting domain-containing protein [Bacteroidia bacterium]|nr:T9SS type A sorting domain-containing protein [Bacteroidia bacterium]